jgi:hypothetical protein
MACRLSLNIKSFKAAYKLGKKGNCTTVLHCILLSLKFRLPSPEFFLVSWEGIHIIAYWRIRVTNNELICERKRPFFPILTNGNLETKAQVFVTQLSECFIHEGLI